MEEQEVLRNKLIKHIAYNIIGFALIFIIFGIFIFLLVKGVTYSSVIKDLYDSKKTLLEVDNEKINIIIDSNYITKSERDSWIQNSIKKYQDYMLARKILNPNVILILRDLDKKIINESEIGRYVDYTDEIDFDENNLNKIYEVTLDEKYSYMGLNFIFDGNGITEDRYIQLLVNIDSEKDLVANYLKIISLAVFVGIMLSIITSYILAQKTLEPLRENIIKQMEFVQNASHELRTPLTIIQAKQELLLQEPNAKIIDKSEDIILTLNETKRLTKLIKDLMILSRADAKKMSLQKENINIDEYIKEVIGPYSEIAQMQEKEIILDLNYNMDIDVDTSRFYQLMIILLDNAIKYTETKDKIEIKTYLKDNKFVMEVKDTGIGVSDEGLKRIFERFYREDKARSRETGGSGLGLSIADFIVTSHGGNIRASHNKPKGTVFTIRLPR